MRDNTDSCRIKRSLLCLREHPANEQFYAKFWKRLSSFKRITGHQGFFLAMLFLFINDIHK
jgi:hypothetical protein